MSTMHLRLHVIVALHNFTQCVHGEGSLQSLDWNGGMEWWNGIVECVLWGERSLPMQFSIKVLQLKYVTC